MPANNNDTIYALATPYAKSGVAIIRISGNGALGALKKLSGMDIITPNRAFLGHFRDNTGIIIDSGIGIYFQAPHSFTGEDVAELQLHGSPAVIKHALVALSMIENLRPAEAGEFTRRAYLNGKMDLLEAEGLADLINAETEAQKTQAIRQMQGSASGYYQKLREQIITTLAHMEAYIDFPDDEIPESVLQGLEGEVGATIKTIESTLADGKRGERVRTGFSVVILGAPNAGKSSLINSLSGKNVAIVSHRAGTTRDIIEVQMDLGGFPVTLVDTAGIRESQDEIEEEGVRRALKHAAEADLKLVLFDGTQLPELDEASRNLIDDGTIVVVSKSDIAPQINNLLLNNNIFYISSVLGQGIEELLAAIQKYISVNFSSMEPALITRERHRTLLLAALANLQRFSTRMPLELACEELRQAAGAIGKITGKIQVDEVLDVVFRQFCIGK